MKTDSRYFFVIPEVRKPVGGVNVLIRIAERLAARGADVRLLHATPGYRYEFWDTDLPVCHDPALRAAFWRHESNSRNPLKRLLPKGVSVSNGHTDSSLRVTPGPGDVVVMPEYTYPEITPVYPEARRVLAVQDSFGFFRAIRRDPELRHLHAAKMIFTTSETSRAAVATVHDGPAGKIVLPVGFAGLDFGVQKDARIAYMPRKRPDEVAAVVTILRQAPELADYTFTEIDRVSHSELAEILNRSRFFLSFSQEEGFGLPPAEAMRAGCIVIGYTGVGGAEYFTAETGIVVPDSDIVCFISAVRSAAREYAADPTRLDAIRRHAANQMTTRYTEATFAETTDAVWRTLL